MKPMLFEQETVKVRDTGLSNLPGHAHVEVTLGAVPSLAIARRLQKFLEKEEKVSSVGLTWDGDSQIAVLRTFVTATFAVDATGFVQGLFGLQAQAFA